MRTWLVLLFIGFMFSTLVNDQSVPQDKKPRVDAYGDPLPEGAVARLGTSRWRHDGAVRLAIFSPDEKRVASVAGDSAGDDNVYLWDSATGKLHWRSNWGPAKQLRNKISCLDFSPDGATLVAGLADTTGGVASAVFLLKPGKAESLHLVSFDADSGKIKSKWKEQNQPVLAVKLLNEGKALVTFDESGMVRWWDTAKQEVVKQWQAVEAPKEAKLNPLPGLRMSAVWSPKGDKLAYRMLPSGLRFDNMGVTVIALDVEKQTKIWSSERNLAAMSGPLAFSTEGKTIVVGGSIAKDGGGAVFGGGFGLEGKSGISFFELATGKELDRLESSRNISFSGNGKVFASARALGVGIFDSATGKLIKSLKTAISSDEPTVSALALSLVKGRNESPFVLSHSGKSLLFAHSPQSLRILDTERDKIDFDINTTSNPIIWLRFAPDGRALHTFSGKVESARNGQFGGFGGFGGSGSSMSNHEFITWSMDSWKASQTLKSPTQKDFLVKTKTVVTRLIPSPDQSIVLVDRQGDDNVDVREGDSFKYRSTLSLPASEKALLELGPVVFSPNNRFVALAEDGLNSWHVFEVITGNRILRVDLGGKADDLESSAWRIVFSANDSLMAVAELDGRIAIYEMPNAKLKSRLEGAHRQWLLGNSTMVFSPDGQWLAAWGEKDGPIRVWDLATGKQERELAAGKAPAKGNLLGTLDKETVGITLAISPDNRSLAVIPRDNPRIVQVWELSSARLRKELKGHSGEIKALAWSPDGRLLASGSADTTVLVWDVWGNEKR